MYCVPSAPLPQTDWGSHTVLERHFHGPPYAALVLSGTYLEAGDFGRISAHPGHVLFHSPWSAHRNTFGRRGARIINIPYTEEYPSPRAYVADPDTIVRLAERDPQSAGALFGASLLPLPVEADDWPDRLARDLASDPDLALGLWARSAGLRPETVSRGFRQVFGVTAARFRRDIRTGRAIRRIAAARVSLAEIAAETGFADQSHMSRAVKGVTGFSPAQLGPGSISFKADRCHRA